MRRYYDSINRRNLTQAYDCLSKGFKARSPIEKFAQIFASTQSIEIQTLQEDSRDDARAVVTVSFIMEVDAETIHVNGISVSPLSKRAMRGASIERNRQHDSRQSRSSTGHETCRDHGAVQAQIRGGSLEWRSS